MHRKAFSNQAIRAVLVLVGLFAFAMAVTANAAVMTPRGLSPPAESSLDTDITVDFAIPAPSLLASLAEEASVDVEEMASQSRFRVQVIDNTWPDRQLAENSDDGALFIVGRASEDQYIMERSPEKKKFFQEATIAGVYFIYGDDTG